MSDQKLVAWDVSAGKVVWEYKGQDPISNIFFTPDGRFVSAHTGPGLKFFRSDTGDEVGAMTSVGKYAFSPDGRKLVTTSKNGIVIRNVPRFENRPEE